MSLPVRSLVLFLIAAKIHPHLLRWELYRVVALWSLHTNPACGERGRLYCTASDIYTENVAKSRSTGFRVWWLKLYRSSYCGSPDKWTGYNRPADIFFFFPGAYRSDKRKRDPKREFARLKKPARRGRVNYMDAPEKIAFTHCRNVKRCFSRLKVVNFVTQVYFCGTGFRLRTWRSRKLYK